MLSGTRFLTKRFDHQFSNTILSLMEDWEKNEYSTKFMVWLKWSEQSSPDPGKGVGSGEKIKKVFFNYMMIFLHMLWGGQTNPRISRRTKSRVMYGGRHAA